MAASGGGHLRQLLDLEPFWSKHDYFFLSEDTSLSQSIGQDHPVRFLPHFAFGQLRLGSPLSVIGAAFRNLVASARVMASQRPDIFLTTGAGAVFFSLIWARLFGARIIVIESFARVTHASVFGRLAAPFAHEHIVQSQALTAQWPKARVFDPLRVLQTTPPPKQPLLFGTVGAILPFDRLVDMIATAKQAGAIPEDILVQVGANGRSIKGVETVETLPFERVKLILQDASIVVCHGGTGSIITALRQGCHVIAVPRLFALGEVYDDHQSEITGALAERGLISVARTQEEFEAALIKARSAQRVVATSDPTALIDHIISLVTPPSKD